MTFTIPIGTAAVVLSDVEGVWIKTHITTKKENVFQDKDVKADPTGSLRSSRCWGPSDETIGGMHAKDGFYCFYANRVILMVQKEFVVVDGMAEEEEESGEDES